MFFLTKRVLEEVAHRAQGSKRTKQRDIIDAISMTLLTTANAYGISTYLRRAHFIAQICHESDRFCTLIEYASGKHYEHRTDLGNTEPGDGIRYKGRGLIQITGRANYALYGNLIGAALEDSPELAADPSLAVQIACSYWKRRRIDRFCDTDDIKHVTRLVNGGLNGLQQRQYYLVRAKVALKNLIPDQMLWAGPDGPGYVSMQISTV